MPATTGLPEVICYEELIADQPELAAWPALDENTAASLCYTSGTTGNPRGVLYSHRSTVLHAMTINFADCFALTARDAALPIVPMFHVNAWGLPYAAPMTGCKLVLPGPNLDGASLQRLIEAEGVTISGGVPTVWLGLLTYLRESGKSLYSTSLVTFEDDKGAYDQKDAEGFIRLNALRLRTLGMRDRTKK